MKRILLLAVIVVSCGSPQPQSTIILLGKTIEYRYGESVYHVTINSDSTLHWKAVAGNEVGVKADETYVAEWIDFKRLFITWGEANGTGVSQILDFEKGKVLNHLIHNREASKGEGEIRILEK